MNRILVIGCAGSGKSTLSRKLHYILELPVIHLDTYYWNADWVAKSNEEWEKIVERFTNEEHWIVDGNYTRTMDIRISRADLIIFLDMPRLLCMYRVIKRRIIYHKRSLLF